jgi:mono/diheme cytochrome c family protein
MKLFLKITAFIALCIGAFLMYVQLTYKQTFQAPVTGIKSSSDSTVIGRGKYLVLGAAHCYTCHMPDSLLKAGAKEQMIGGHVFETPFGTMYTPNITSDKETGIGNFTDEQLARAIRYHINHKNEAMVGFMSYNAITDDDLTAIVSFLRTVPPMPNKVEPNDYNMLGKILMRFMVKPADPVIATIKPDTTAEYGKYLAYHVTNCNGCHTQRGPMGNFTGEPFSGGSRWDYDDAVYTSPNLTFDDSTGRISKWSQQVFIERFRAGKALPNTPMPWGAYQNLTDDDLTALYKFLKSLPPVHHEIKQTYSVKQSQ